MFEAVENGYLPADAELQERARRLQTRRQEVLADIAKIKRSRELPESVLSAHQAATFSKALTAQLKSNRPFAKQYLRLLVDEVRIEAKTAVMRGSYANLAMLAAQKKMGTLERVPTFGSNWLPDLGSNQGPAD
ncbi:MAG: hypothetical protein ACK5UX_11765 [Burkholderiales bacterium]|nr:hypothetical protein [Nitrosomonadaceae bacterium]